MCRLIVNLRPTSLSSLANLDFRVRRDGCEFLRAVVKTVASLATFDQVKEAMVERGAMGDGVEWLGEQERAGDGWCGVAATTAANLMMAVARWFVVVNG
ncbi:hypothetical protein Drorol1_Dr00015222 [Drosera rotundifolia]